MSDPAGDDSRTTTRRRADGIGLGFAALFLVIAVSGIGGGTWWLIPGLLPWLAAGVATAIGLGLIASSLPRRGAGRR